VLGWERVRERGKDEGLGDDEYARKGEAFGDGEGAGEGRRAGKE
jgi:hypothetical protein